MYDSKVFTDDDNVHIFLQSVVEKQLLKEKSEAEWLTPVNHGELKRYLVTPLRFYC